MDLYIRVLFIFCLLILSSYYLDKNDLQSGIRTGIVSLLFFMIYFFEKIMIVIEPLVEAMK